MPCPAYLALLYCNSVWTCAIQNAEVGTPPAAPRGVVHTQRSHFRWSVAHVRTELQYSAFPSRLTSVQILLILICSAARQFDLRCGGDDIINSIHALCCAGYSRLPGRGAFPAAPAAPDRGALPCCTGSWAPGSRGAGGHHCMWGAQCSSSHRRPASRDQGSQAGPGNQAQSCCAGVHESVAQPSESLLLSTVAEAHGWHAQAAQGD